MYTGTVSISQLKVKSRKLKNYWKMIAYVFEVYPNKNFSFQLFIVFRVFTREIHHFLKTSVAFL